MSVFSRYQDRYQATQQEVMSLQDYLELCKKDPSVYATAAERLLLAIGEPQLVDTSKDLRLSRIFSNKVIKRYPAFNEFYGMEEAVESIVSYFRHAAQGLEERKQVLYLLGPVGGGKSSLAERLKLLIQNVPFYAIKGSPVFESPLGLFDPAEDADILEEDFGIPRRYLGRVMSPWAVKRLHEFNGDISQKWAAISANSKWSSFTLRLSTRSGWPKPSRATKTTRIFPHWWARWIFANWKTIPRMTRMPTPIPVPCAAPTRA